MPTNPNPVSSGGGLQPGQFTPEAYGAVGDGKIFSDAAITTGTSVLTSPGNHLVGAAAGQVVYIPGAGAAGADFYTTIASVQSAGQVTLAANAGTTVSGKGCAFGTDNGTAILNCHNAAWSYAEANAPNKAQVVFSSKVYVVGAAISWTRGASLEGNALFPFPIVAGSGATKATVDYVGLGGDVCALPHWLQTEPQFTGSTVLVLRADGTNDATYGPSSVFGGPFNTYGGEPGTYTNISVTVNQVCIAAPFNPTFGGWDFFGVAEAFVPNGAFMTLGVVPAAGAWPQFNNASISNAYPWGLRMPSAGNNDRCDVGYWSAYGLCYGFGPSEHATWQSVRCNYCIIGVEAYAGNGVNMAHAMIGAAASCEQCNAGLGFFDGGVKIELAMLDTESGANSILDASNRGQGTVGVRGDHGPGYWPSGFVSGGANLRILNLNQAPGPVASPQAPVASGSAWLNGYYKDAWITLLATTITALKIDAVTQNLPTGTVTEYSFMVPSGHSYTWTGTGTVGTNVFHTVTLL